MADPIKDYLAAIGRRGGQATSEAKRFAADANGRKGGRPPKNMRKTRKPNHSRQGRGVPRTMDGVVGSLNQEGAK